MKNVVVLIPGLFDTEISSLGGVSPVEKAETPTLDEIAQQGQWVRVHPPKGGLEHSLLELFGLESGKTHLSRSSLEVYSRNVPFKPSESSFLFQFVSLFEDQIVDSDPSLLKMEELELLCRELNQTFENWIQFMPLGQSRGVCLIKETFEHLNEPDIPKNLEGKKWSSLLPDFFKKNRREEKIEALNKFLKEHPLNKVREDFEERTVNGILFEAGGAPLNAIISKKFYERFCLYSPNSSSRGLANLLAMRTLESPSQRSIPHLQHIVHEVKNALQQHQTVILELHEVLESTLKGHLLEKIKRIEYLDRNLLAPLAVLCRELGIQLIVTPFKNTRIEEQKIVEGAVPWIFYNPRHRKSIEPILAFREKEFDRIHGQFSIRAMASQFLY